MSGYKIKFNGVDRLYDAYSWRLNRRAKAVWQSGDVLQGKYLKQLEIEIAKKYKRKYAVGVGSATDGLYFAMKAVGINKGSTVLCPAFSYVATTGAIKRIGADIHFVDTDKHGNIGEAHELRRLRNDTGPYGAGEIGALLSSNVAVVWTLGYGAFALCFDVYAHA